MKSGIYDTVILTDQFFAAVLRDITKFVVDVGDQAALIGDRDDS